MSQSLTSLVFHIIFSTKERRNLLQQPMRSRIYEYIGGIVRTQQGTLIAIGGTKDHVHLLILMNKNLTIPASLKDIKSVSTKWIHNTFRDLQIFSWQGGYAAFSVSNHDISEIKAYIENQEEHHHKVTFQEELLSLLKDHGIEYDERYLWE